LHLKGSTQVTLVYSANMPLVIHEKIKWTVSDRMAMLLVQNPPMISISVNDRFRKKAALIFFCLLCW
jgi:hypothetical protein